MSGNLRAGVARADITPPVGVDLCGFSAREKPSQGVHDALEAKALVLDNGSKRIAILTADLIGLPRALVQELFARLEKTCGLAAGDVMVACSHTHSGPNTGVLTDMGSASAEYIERLLAGLVDAAAAACEDSRPAAIGGAVHPSGAQVSYNRAFDDGPLDRDLGMVKVVDGKTKRTMAVLVNYTCHPVVLGPENLDISADYPGALQRAVEAARRTAGAVCLFTNGACGDINPLAYRDSQQRPDFAAMEDAAAQLAEEALAQLPAIDTSTEAALATAATSVDLPLAQGGSMPIELKAVGVNDVILVGIPGEVFVEVALAIKRRFPSNKVLVVGYADYVMGYIPTEEDFRRKGYASTGAPHYYAHPLLRSDVAQIVIDASSELLEELTSRGGTKRGQTPRK